MSERERERERETQSPNHLSVHQWLRFAIHGSQQLTLPIGFLSLKRPPPPDAALLAHKMSSGMGYCRYPMILSNYSLPYFDDIAPPKPHQVLPLGFRERWWEVHGRSKRQHRRLHDKLCLLQPQRKVPAEDVPRSKHCFFGGDGHPSLNGNPRESVYQFLYSWLDMDDHMKTGPPFGAPN